MGFVDMFELCVQCCFSRNKFPVYVKSEWSRLVNHFLKSYIHYDPLMMSQKESPRNHLESIQMLKPCNMHHIFDKVHFWISGFSRQYITIHCNVGGFYIRRLLHIFDFGIVSFIKLLNRISPFVYLTSRGEDSTDILNYYFQTRVSKRLKVTITSWSNYSWKVDIFNCCYKTFWNSLVCRAVS